MREPWTWLLEKRHVRGGLRSVSDAIRSGRLDDATPDHRAALMRILHELWVRPDNPPRVRLRLLNLIVLIDRKNMERGLFPWHAWKE